MANTPIKPAVTLQDWTTGQTRLNSANLTGGINTNLSNIKTAVDGVIDCIDDMQEELAPAYDATSTYEVGDLCTYQGGLYACSTAIPVAEAWDPSHWTATVVSEQLGSYETATDLEIHRMFRTEYPIAATATAGTITGDSTIWTEETASLLLTPDTGMVLSELAVVNATNTYDSATGDITLSAPTGNVSVNAICAVVPKGSIISFDAKGDGVQRKFRVLKCEGNIAKLLSLDETTNSKFNVSSRTTAFDNGSSYQQYAGGTLDTYMNETYYGSLDSNVQAAIIATARVQSCYDGNSYETNPPSTTADFNLRNGSYYKYYTRKTQVTVGDRYCFALDFDDIKEYFGLQKGSILLLSDLLAFLSDGTSSSALWYSSACYGSQSAAWVQYSSSYPSPYNYSNSSYARPCFSIDLSQISFTLGGN